MRRRGRGPLGGEAATARGRSPEARAFFAPGNPAIARQALLISIRACAAALALIVLVACIPFVPLSIALFQRFVRDDSSASREMRACLSAQFLEAIQGLSTLVGIGAADRVGERLARTGEDNRLAVMRVLARNQLILFVMEGVFSLFLVTAAIVVSWIRPPRQKVAKNASSERGGLHFGRIVTRGSAPAS